METIKENASAVFALAGVFGTAVLSFIGAWLLRRRDYDLKLWERLLDRRIRGHENLINIALEMRVTVILGGLDETGQVLRAPQVLISKEEFERWFTRSIATATEASPWLSTASKREVSFLQDYLVTLHHNLVKFPSDNYLKVGAVIRRDFLDLSATLERSAFSFFEGDIRRLKLSDVGQPTYDTAETERKLRRTQLFQKWNDVEKIGLQKSEGADTR